VITTHHRSIFI